MKKIIFTLILSLVFLSCSDDSVETIKTEEARSISSTETLELFLAKTMPVEGGYSISQQAMNFSVSEIQYRENGVFYVYAPKEGFTGTDIVKIKREDSDGAKVFSETITTLNIEVTE